MAILVYDVWLIRCPKYVQDDARPALDRLVDAFDIAPSRAEWLLRRMPICVTRGASPETAHSTCELLRGLGAEVRVHTRRPTYQHGELIPPHLDPPPEREESTRSDLVLISPSSLASRVEWDLSSEDSESVDESWEELAPSSGDEDITALLSR